MRTVWGLIIAALVSIPLARWTSGDVAARMSRYRSLSRDALVAVLEEQHKGGFTAAYIGNFMLFVAGFSLIYWGGTAVENVRIYIRIRRRIGQRLQVRDQMRPPPS